MIPSSDPVFLMVINPAASGSASLLYGTHFGGTSGDYGYAVAVDSYGKAYVTGSAFSTNLPTTPGAFQRQNNQGGCGNAPCGTAFVAKFDPQQTGSASLIYSTFLGGSGPDIGWGIEVDNSGSAYVTGQTSSSRFPVTAGAFQTVVTGNPPVAFISKLNPGGSNLVYSTLFGSTGKVTPSGTGDGGDTVGHAIALDASGNAYVVGATDSQLMPITPDAFQPINHGGTGTAQGSDAFVFKVNQDGTNLLYASYLGGSGDDNARGVAVDGSGDVYLTGSTTSHDFPRTPGAMQSLWGGRHFMR